MDYNLMTDEDIIRDLAEQVDKIRIEHHMKETEMEESAGISRKTFYNFKQGSTGTSLKNFIRFLRAVGELERLKLMFPESESYSPRVKNQIELPKRVRDKRKPDDDFQWGDEG
jgi:predicted transcriptional regulator